VVPDETKLAIANRATRGSARLKTFGARRHCSLLLVLSSLFVDGLRFVEKTSFQRDAGRRDGAKCRRPSVTSPFR
jgi:hypothetical protein